MNKGFTPTPQSSIKSFTLIEIIVVIIIVGILAAVGLTQYSTTVESSRGGEARMIIGQIRTLAVAYRLENGSKAGMGNGDVTIGTADDQIPSACRSSHFFRYYVLVQGDPTLNMFACRCTSGGRSPQYGTPNVCLQWNGSAATGIGTWICNGCNW